MRKFLFILSTIVIAGQLIGQNTFNKLEDYLGTNGNSSNFLNNTIKVANNYYCEIDAYDTLGNPKMILLKLDLNGNEVDKFVFIHPKGRLGTYPNQTIIKSNDSNLLLCTNILYNSTNSWSGYLIKFNKNLDTLWSKAYDLPNNLAGCNDSLSTISTITAIKETPDKGFIIAGNYYKYCVNNNSNLRGFLLKVDSLGNIEWWKAFNDVADLFDIELSVNGGYLVFNKWGGKILLNLIHWEMKFGENHLTMLPVKQIQEI